MKRRDLFEGRSRDYGNSRERAIQSRGGYTATPGSGSSSQKGDLRRGEWMVEVKATKADSFRVSDELMAKLRNDGLTNGRPGVMIVEVGSGRKFAVMDLEAFERLVPDAD